MLRRVIFASLLIGLVALSASFNQLAFAQNDGPLPPLKVPTNSVQFNHPQAGKVDNFLLHSPFFAQLAQKLVEEMDIGRWQDRNDICRPDKENALQVGKGEA